MRGCSGLAVAKASATLDCCGNSRLFHVLHTGKVSVKVCVCGSVCVHMPVCRPAARGSELSRSF